MKKTKSHWQILALSACALGLALLLARCQETPPPTPPGSIVPPPNTPPTRPRGTMPATPIKLEKPRTIGPAMPAIVVLPRNLAEPTIRVRLTREEDVRPVVPAANYRGAIEHVRTPNGKYVAVNVLPLESYLMGLNEIYPSWSLETHRAQTVAARTYALFALMTEGRSKLWDVTNDESSQVYKGKGGENDKTRAAVRATRGQVLITTWQDQTGIFCSFYSSCSGLASQDPFEAWGDPSIAPLSARLLGNADAASPKYRWAGPLTVSKADLSRAIYAWGQRNGFSYLQNLGPIKTVAITKTNAITGRPVELTLTDGAGRSAPIRAEEFRLALKTDPWNAAPKPPSSCFKLRDLGDQIVLYDGYGFGHGIGMSQWGAQNLAQAGRSAEQILAFYYPGSKLQRAW